MHTKSKLMTIQRKQRLCRKKKWKFKLKKTKRRRRPKNQQITERKAEKITKQSVKQTLEQTVKPAAVKLQPTEQIVYKIPEQIGDHKTERTLGQKQIKQKS